jgi:hypothetical protein
MKKPPLRRSGSRLLRLLERAWQESRFLHGSGRHSIGRYVLHALRACWSRAAWDDDAQVMVEHRIRQVA